MKKEIRIKRNELKSNSIRLRELSWEQDLPNDASFKLRKKQDDEYKRYIFYDNFIKANDKVKRG